MWYYRICSCIGVVTVQVPVADISRRIVFSICWHYISLFTSKSRHGTVTGTGIGGNGF